MKEKLWTTTFVVNMLLNFIFYLVFYLPTVVIGTMAMERYHSLLLVSLVFYLEFLLSADLLLDFGLEII